MPARWFGCGVLVVVLAGCGSDDDQDSTLAGVAGCDSDTFAIDGSIAGEAVSQRGMLTNHAWVQFGSSNTLDVDFEGGGSVHTSWGQVVADGRTTPITGSITFPPGGTRGGSTLTAAAGAQNKVEDEVRFRLEQLAESVECFAPPCPAQAIAGTLTGCIHWEHIGP